MRVHNIIDTICVVVPCRLLCSIKCMSMSDERNKEEKKRMKGAEKKTREKRERE